MINVWGDSVGAGIVESLCKKQLAKEDNASDDSQNSILGNDELLDSKNEDMFKLQNGLQGNGYQQNGVKRPEAYNPGYLADSGDVNVRF